MTDEKHAILDLTARWADAVRARDVPAIMAFYADDVRAFDAVGALQFRGRQAYAEHWDACMRQCSGASRFEIHQQEVSAGGGLGVSSYLVFAGGTNEEGVEQSCWMRGTTCWQHRQGEWKVIHEHYSVPFDMASGQTAFDLEP